VPNCAETGVLGVLPGTVGSIQATEAAKLLLGEGEPLVGRLLFYDAASLETEVVPYEQNPDCPVCGDDGVGGVVAGSYDGDCRLEPEGEQGDS
jgi:adenylyltransferase/sulfurtransferase